VTAAAAERPGVTLVTFGAFAFYGLLRWATLMRPVPWWRLMALGALALLIFGLATGALRLPRALRDSHASAARHHAVLRFIETGWRLGALGTLAAVLALAAVLGLSGIPVSWLYQLRVAVIARGIGSGLSALPGTLVPYLGINSWVRLVIVLGAGLLVVGAALAGGLPSRMSREARRATGALLLAALAVIPATIIHPQLPYVQGLLLFVFVSGFMWGDRIAARRSTIAVAVIASAALFAGILAPPLNPSQSWFNYQKLASGLAPKHLERFDWSQRYGPYVWPRQDREVLAVRATHADYWKAQNLDVFDGYGWEQGAGPIDSLAPPPAPWAVKRWSQRLTVTVDAMRTTDVIAAGFARRPAHLDQGVDQALGDGTWTASAPLRPGQTYTVSTYSPRPSATQLAAVPAGAYPDAPLADYRVVGLPPSPAARFNRPELEFPRFHSGGLILNLASPYGPIGASLVRSSPYASAYALASSLAAGSATPYAFVVAVKRYLSTANGFRYYEHTPLTRFPLETFLFASKRGYCQHFAGAMALLLRLGGLPARVVTGFTAGQFDSTTDTYVVSDRDAHAWVEVWFPRYGWVRFDPTPAVDPAFADGANGSNTGAPSSKPGASPAPRVRDLGAAGTGRQGGNGGSSLALLIGLAIALGLALLAGGLLWRRAASSDELTAELERALARSGRPARDGLTLHALEHRFRESSAAVSYLRRLRLARYGRVSELPTTEQRRALRRQLAVGLGIRGWMRSWWALPPRRLRPKDT
jgi:transglutaminase-like putative cysteine protease